MQLLSLPRSVKYLLVLAADVGVFWASAYVATAVHWGDPWPVQHLAASLAPLLTGLVLFLLFLSGFGLYKEMLRYAELEMLRRVASATTAAAILNTFLSQYLFEPAVPVALSVLMWLLVIAGSLGARIIGSAVVHRDVRASGADVERIMIYGAGKGGRQILRSAFDARNVEVVAFLDDDRQLAGRSIMGRPIFVPERAAELVEEQAIDAIVLAMPSLSGQGLKKILANLSGVGAKIRVLPSVDKLIGGEINFSQVRDVEAQDLLWREPHAPDQALLEADTSGKNVMVTGGGGSIGSELCRQIVRTGASKLVIVENSEYALYRIEQELREDLSRRGDTMEVVPVLLDCTDLMDMRRALSNHKVETLYHAAAYKHVPLVEYNVCSGVRNNLFGTLNTAQAARAEGVQKFVLISTDKAVRPTNVMGASKRLAEMVLQALDGVADAVDDRAARTRFTMVRFGNVLDSAGSVVPLFRRQIQDGGPITLTHHNVTRYFMTIPEASQLVLQAGAMAQGGEVFVLDMGEPVRIMDLAVRMVQLSGLSVADDKNPDGDIQIIVTGMRPGEKLYEEVFLGDNATGTLHPNILRAEESFLGWDQLSAQVDNISRFAKAGDEVGLKNILSRIVEGYKPPIGPFVERRRTARLSIVE